jgi:LmbE family N-acetylglucosaminyl deacetylase
LEILAVSGIFECFHDDDKWFTGVVVTDGAGSARHGKYRGHTDERMRQVRRIEQKKAAVVGGYTAQVLLNHRRRSLIHDARTVVQDLKSVLETTAPEVIFTHSLTDKHDSHVAVALRVIQACREASSDARPVRVLGCEVWRDLDWLSDADKVILGLGDQQHLEQALLGVFDSQIAGGRRYDTAVLGRRRAHATFSRTTDADADGGCCYAMDLTPLLNDPQLDPALYCERLVQRFQVDIAARLERLNTK